MGASPAVLQFFLKTAGLVVRGLGGWAKHKQIRLRLSVDDIEAAQGYGAKELRIVALCGVSEAPPHPENFLSFSRLAAEGSGEEPRKKWQGNFRRCVPPERSGGGRAPSPRGASQSGCCWKWVRILV